MTDDDLSDEAEAARAAWIARCEEITRSRFPPRFADAAATDPDVIAWCDAYVGACQQKARLPAQWSLLLTGPLGVGKTHQAYGAICRIVTAGIDLTWRAASLPDLLDLLRPRDGTDSHAEYERWAGADLLLVDDLGADKPTEWADTTLYRLVNHRSEWLLPTIWTSNLRMEPKKDDNGRPAPLKSELPGRVFSRLSESRLVVLNGEDRRKPPS